MKEGSEGDGDDVPTSRDADSTVSNGGPRMVHEGFGGTALANALLGFGLDRTNGGGNDGDALHGIHSTNTRIVKGGGQKKEKEFPCNICHRSFGYKHVLQNHERTHTGEKPFECKECHKRFTRDHHLKTHMRLHTGEKPYHCSHCERQFVQVANLRRHLRVHTGERPYACNLCSSRFSDSNQLKAHVLIHEGVKPFECLRCGGRFRRRHHLVHHKCPKDEANIGKPRRGRRPKAYDELPTMLSSLKQERLPTPIADLLPPPPPQPVSLTSVIKREPPPIPQPAHLQKAMMSTHQSIPLHLQMNLRPPTSNGGGHYRDTEGPIDMTVSSASAPVSVIVPRIPYNTHPASNHSSVEGVLDLSNSRSDSEAEPIEEEVDEEDDCVDEGMDSDSEEEEEEQQQQQRMISAWNNHNHYVAEDLTRGVVNGDQTREEHHHHYSEQDDPYGDANSYGED